MIPLKFEFDNIEVAKWLTGENIDTINPNFGDTDNIVSYTFWFRSEGNLRLGMTLNVSELCQMFLQKFEGEY